MRSGSDETSSEGGLGEARLANTIQAADCSSHGLRPTHEGHDRGALPRANSPCLQRVAGGLPAGVTGARGTQAVEAAPRILSESSQTAGDTGARRICISSRAKQSHHTPHRLSAVAPTPVDGPCGAPPGNTYPPPHVVRLVFAECVRPPRGT